ncbi:helix-turn-helix domain-containing protein [Micromonospora endophytica]|uniref:Transcriptional regulator n=1 Tax=Micromonospora endophytica TaxID=515350 RepID=A0A2W2CB71_9ACTN|nr:helix-turn-helix transcriptional regulator [Micromonospora endophytica]PZF90134.1 transcriptional regulator [Micromonospora endophytica]RIW44658.1 XRE family transcriptional regulator [Micromonospora endophytica]BCJ60402.1 transcriptional regulator [Micromonospora endophytica]
MPPAAPSPIRRRSRLGSALRRLREDAGLTGDQVIDRVGWASASKLSRLENGRSRPDPQDVQRLLDLYGAGEAEQAELLDITRQAADMRAWLKKFPAMTQQQRVFAELEAGCAEISEYSPVLVPGLLQTAGYARLRLSSAQQIDQEAGDAEIGEDIDTEIKARQSRQELLTQDTDAPKYTAVLEEAALGLRAGPPEVIREQLMQLRELSTLSNVKLHVLLRDTPVGEWYLPPTAFSLYRFADPQDPETLAIEGGFTDVMSTEKIALNRYKVVFERLCTAALSETDTYQWLTQALGWLSAAVTPSTQTSGSATAPAQRRGSSGRLTER